MHMSNIPIIKQVPPDEIEGKALFAGSDGKFYNKSGKQLKHAFCKAKRIRNKTTELREAIDYADMVVDYVNNGSGTHDFIDKAISGLQEALKTVADQMPQRRSDN